jgi:cyanophycin synthetase
MKREVLPSLIQCARTATPPISSLDPFLHLPDVLRDYGAQLDRLSPNKKRIEIINILFLRGPNIWTYRPALEAWIDIGELEDFPSDTIPGFPERLSAWLPTLVEHRCGIGERGGFLQRLREGTWAGHILEHVMIELQTLAGIPTGFGKARETSTRGVYKVVVRTPHEATGRVALHAARDLVMAAIEDRSYDVAAAVERLRTVADDFRLGPNTACIVDAATDRRIPSIRLNEGNLVQLGYGARQRRIWAAETVQTTAIAESIASDKALSKRLLQSCGVPVAEGRLVDSAEDAWEAAQDIDAPVVVKPCDGAPGCGISTNLTTCEQIEAAYRKAREEDRDVLVERFIDGSAHRLLIVGGRMVAAARREADGAADVTDLVHPDIAAAASLAARIVGLDIAGVDLVARDVSRPLAEQRGAIVDINARPGLLMHSKPAHGTPRPVGHAIVDHVFADEENGRIPIVGISGSHGRTLVAQLVAKLLQTHGAHVGVACGNGLYLNQRRIAQGDCATWESAQRILLNRMVDAAVFESSGHAILSEGLGYDRCKIGVVTGIACDDILPDYYINDAEQMARVIRTQVDVVLPDGVAVLNGADARVAALAPLCDGEVIFFGPAPEIVAIVEHRSRQGRAVFVRNSRLVFAAGAEETIVANVLPAASRSSGQLEGILAAAATAWALALPLDLIRTGLDSFIDADNPAAIHLNATTPVDTTA